MTAQAETPLDRNITDGVIGNKAHALQVICLGSGGGPDEDNVTGFLVRSIASDWAKGSLLAVDAGSHLAAITRILKQSFPLYSDTVGNSEQKNDRRPSTVLNDGPFAGIKFSNESARANALQLLHHYISCYLITHPHLDHLSGFAINTAALSGRSRPKTLAALPGTVDAVKRHIFNDVIWPNLSDEDGGVGFVTFQRLKEGGDPMIGVGQGRGYIDVCDGIGAKAFCVSHGLCTKSSSQQPGSVSNAADFAAALHNNMSAEPAIFGKRSFSTHEHSVPGTPGGVSTRRASMFASTQQYHAPSQTSCVVDSTAYFLRDEDSGREILMFGDIEPDSISSLPRNERVWNEAAPKIANGSLKAVFIECSYSDAVADETLFGHLCPRHLIAELSTLADAVHTVKSETTEVYSKKRKRSSLATATSPRYSDAGSIKRRSRSRTHRGSGDSRMDIDHSRHESVHFSVSTPSAESDGLALSPRAMAAKNVSAVPNHVLPLQTYRNQALNFSMRTTWEDAPLRGLTVVVIHVKDTFKDGPPVTDTILSELQQHERDLLDQGNALGCKFLISKCGESYSF